MLIARELKMTKTVSTSGVQAGGGAKFTEHIITLCSEARFWCRSAGSLAIDLGSAAYRRKSLLANGIIGLGQSRREKSLQIERTAWPETCKGVRV